MDHQEFEAELRRESYRVVFNSQVPNKRVENHWRKTPEVKELEFRWVPEGVTRLATLLAEEVRAQTVRHDPPAYQCIRNAAKTSQ